MKYINLSLLNGTTLVASATTLFESNSLLKLQLRFNRFSKPVTASMVMGATYVTTNYVVSKYVNSRFINGCQVIDLELEYTGCLL